MDEYDVKIAEEFARTNRTLDRVLWFSLGVLAGAGIVFTGLFVEGMWL